MRKDLRRRHDAQVRVTGVCTEHSAVFDATPGGQKARTALATSVANVDRLLALQERSIEDRRAATEQVRSGRRTLRDAAKAVVKIGRLVTLDQPTMATMQLLGHASDDQLLAYMRGLSDRVGAHADAFVAEGLPPDLLARLDDETQRFVAAKEGLAAARQTFTVATDSIRQAQDNAEKTVDALDAIAVNTPAARPEVLRKLRIARRIGPRAPVTQASNPAPSPVPAAAAMTA